MYMLRLIDPSKKAHLTSNKITVTLRSTAAKSNNLTIVKLGAAADSSLIQPSSVTQLLIYQPATRLKTCLPLVVANHICLHRLACRVARDRSR